MRYPAYRLTPSDAVIRVAACSMRAATRITTVCGGRGALARQRAWRYRPSRIEVNPIAPHRSFRFAADLAWPGQPYWHPRGCQRVGRRALGHYMGQIRDYLWAKMDI